MRNFAPSQVRSALSCRNLIEICPEQKRKPLVHDKMNFRQTMFQEWFDLCPKNVKTRFSRIVGMGLHQLRLSSLSLNRAPVLTCAELWEGVHVVTAVLVDEGVDLREVTTWGKGGKRVGLLSFSGSHLRSSSERLEVSTNLRNCWQDKSCK